MKTALIDACLPDDIKKAVAQLSGITRQSVSSIAEEALRAFLAWRVRQVLDLEDAIAAADRGEFVSDDEVTAFFGHYGA